MSLNAASYLTGLGPALTLAVLNEGANQAGRQVGQSVGDLAIRSAEEDVAGPKLQERWAATYPRVKAEPLLSPSPPLQAPESRLDRLAREEATSQSPAWTDPVSLAPNTSPYKRMRPSLLQLKDILGAGK